MLVVGLISSVENIMLNQKHNVKQDTDSAQSQLGRVASYSSPIVHGVTVKNQLEIRQKTACEIQQNIPHGPPTGGFALEIQHHLRYILDD